MLTDGQLKRVERFIDYHGNEAQMIKCIEEMAELTKEITGVLLHPFGFSSGEQGERFVSELADVVIMIEQLSYFAVQVCGIDMLKESVEEKIECHERFLEEVM